MKNEIDEKNAILKILKTVEDKIGEKFIELTEERFLEMTEDVLKNNEDKFTKIKHAICVVAQGLLDLRCDVDGEIKTQKDYDDFHKIQNALLELIADLQPSVTVTPNDPEKLPDNGCNDPDPKDGYGWGEKWNDK